MCFSRNLRNVSHLQKSNTSNERFKILTWNIEGYRSKNLIENTVNKLNVSYVKNMLSSYDVICLLETWSNVNNETEIALKGYTPFYSSRSTKHKNARRDSGGIAVLIKDELVKHVSRQPNLSDDSMWFRIDPKLGLAKSDVYLGAIYIPPEKSSFTVNNALDHWDIIEREIASFKYKGKLLLCGDFNSRSGLLKDHIPLDSCDSFTHLPSSYTPDPHFIRNRCNLDTTVNNYGRQLIDVCNGQFLCILNGRVMGDYFGNYTCLKYNGSSVVDYNLISKDIFSIVESFNVLPLTEFSDHRPLSLNLNTSNICDSPKDSEEFPITCAPGKYIFANGSKTKYIDALQDPLLHQKICDFNTKVYDTNVDSAVDDFNFILKEAAKKSARYIRPKIRKRVTKPWFDTDCFNARCDFLFRKKLYDKFPQNRSIRESFYATQRSYKKLNNKKEIDHKTNILGTLASSSGKNTQNFWSTFKKLTFKEDSLTEKIDPKTWFDYYKKLNKNEVNETSEQKMALRQAELNSQDSTVLDYEFSIEEIKKHICKLKLNKSCGPDLISSEMLKYGKDLLCVSMKKLFNIVLQNGTFPKLWKNGVIINLFKSGLYTNPSNYRGITLTSILGKLFNSLVNSRLVDYLNRNDLITKYQAGFRKDFRPSDNIFMITQTMKIYRSLGKPLYMAFIDLHKAFDKVWRNGLLLKICNSNIGGRMYQVLKSMYSNNVSSVRVNNSTHCTPEFPCEAGVRQGDSLSPTLFNLFMNDIAPLLNENCCNPAMIGDLPIGCLFYADDLVLLSESKEGLQKSLDTLSSYCTKWYLKVNESKSKIMICSKQKLSNNIKFNYNDKELERVSLYKYLGIMISDDSCLLPAHNSLMQKGLKAYYAMNSLLYSANITNTKNYLMLFDALIRPILTYGCEIWGLDLLQKKAPKKFLSGQHHMIGCEKLEIKLYKFILGVPMGTSNIGVRAELLRFPLRYFISSQILKFYYRLKLGSKNNLLNNFFTNLHQLHHNPFSEFLTMLSNAGAELSSPTIPRNISWAAKKTMASLNEKTYERWDEEILSNRKLSVYALVKDSYDIDSYTTEINDRHLRKYLTCLRLGSHPLQIEVGRYNYIPRQERKCTLCNSQNVEDESHFLLSCPLYTTLREDLFNSPILTNVLNKFSDLDKLKCILQPQTQEIAILMCKYVKCCLEIRKQNIHQKS